MADTEATNDEASASPPLERPNTAKRRSVDDASGVSVSPSDTASHGPAPQLAQTAQKRNSKHVVGVHTRGGSRNLSSGRNHKINLTAAAALREDGPQTARNPSTGNGPPLMSPRLKQSIKRNSTSSALVARSTSGTNLSRNLSGNRLSHKAGTTVKYLAPKSAARPDFHRSLSHPNKLRAAGLLNPAQDADTESRNAAQFDLGDEDPETGEMEGVDDGWTDSGSPMTTRDNTRTNTRSNSMTTPDTRARPILDFDKGDLPPDRLGALATGLATNISGPRNNAVLTPSSSTSPQKVTAASSYQDAAAAGVLQPPNAEAIARRLIQRGQRPISAPKVSEVSVNAITAPSHPPENFASSSSGSAGIGASGSGSGSGPRISRFITDSSGNTPMVGSGPGDGQMTGSQQDSITQTPPDHETEKLNDEKRIRSTPYLGGQISPLPYEMMAAAGTHTPPALNRPSRTQQKLWLQRGLSNIEATTQQQAAVFSNFQGGGMPALMRQMDKVEKEYKVIRRFHDPIYDSIDRLKLYSKRLEGLGVFEEGNDIVPSRTGSSTPSKPGRSNDRLHRMVEVPHKATETRIFATENVRSPPADSLRSSSTATHATLGGGGISSSQGSGGHSGSAGAPNTKSSSVSLYLPTPIEEDESLLGRIADAPSSSVPQLPIDWSQMSLDEFEVATIETRRRLWELVQPPETEV